MGEISESQPLALEYVKITDLCPTGSARDLTLIIKSNVGTEYSLSALLVDERTIDSPSEISRLDGAELTVDEQISEVL